MSIQLVVFKLDNEEFGIGINSTTGILSAKMFNVQKLPGDNKNIEGMINLRGNVNYIFNLRSKFNLAEKELSEDSKFIMLSAHDSTVGCTVDDVTDIITLNDDQIEEAPHVACGINKAYITGIGKIGERLIVILDPEELLAEEFKSAS